MRKRLVIGIMMVAMSCSLCGCENSDTPTDRQKYAENAYQLGLAESTALLIMPPEKAAKIQEKIHKAMNEELSLEEQEKVLEEVLKSLEE